MPISKALDSDGFLAEFYQLAWLSFFHDFKIAVQVFFDYGLLPREVNATSMSLIPMPENA